MEKCAELWNKSRRPKTAEKIKEKLGVFLKAPVVTRWNSLYDSFVQLYEMKEKINDLCDTLQVTRFTENDFLYIQEYILINKPIAQAIDFLQQEKNILYGYMLPTLATIRNHYRILKTNLTLNILSQNIIELMETSLISRFEKYFELSQNVDLEIAASVLCPDVKLNFLKALNPDLIQLQIENIGKRIKAKIESEINVDTNIELTPQNTFFNFNTPGKVNS